MKGNLFVLPAIVLIWVFSLFNVSGLGEVFHTNEITIIVFLVLSVGIFLFQIRRNPFVNARHLLLGICLTAVFAGSSIVSGNPMHWITPLSCFLVVFVVGQIRFDAASIRRISMSCGLLGSILLIIYLYTPFLLGWNPNSIAMLGFFSFMLFAISFMDTGYNLMRKFPGLVLCGIYLFLLWQTGSRTSFIAAVLALLALLHILPVKTVCRSPALVFLTLLVPLLIAIFTVWIAELPIMDNLESWSQTIFHKMLFSERNIIWKNGFRDFFENILFGSGYVFGGYWHNFCMACLTSYGILGFSLWISAIFAIEKRGCPYADDPYVQGCLFAFILICIQQSYENGLFSNSDMMLQPYLILGILLGRIKYIEEQQGEPLYGQTKYQCDHPGIQLRK